MHVCERENGQKKFRNERDVYEKERERRVSQGFSGVMNMRFSAEPLGDREALIRVSEPYISRRFFLPEKREEVRVSLIYLGAVSEIYARRASLASAVV